MKEAIQIFNSNKKKINSKKIQIESIEKRYIQSNNSISSNEIKNKKEDLDYNDYNEPIINSNIYIKEGSKVSKSPLSKNFSKINIIKKKINNEDYNFYLTPKNYNTIDKKERKNKIEYNEEQLQIMNKIKTFYNNKKEKIEQQSQENIVDCNIINLNLEKLLKNKKKKNSNNNLYLSKDNNKNLKENKISNNLSEIGMKITPAFGRTTYSFYNKKEQNRNIFNSGRQNNRKINCLKDSLSMALFSSIKQKLNLND